MYTKKLTPAVTTYPTEQEILDALERITKLASLVVLYFDNAQTEVTAFDWHNGGALLARNLYAAEYELYSPKETIEQNIIKAANAIEEWEENINGKAVSTVGG